MQADFFCQFTQGSLLRVFARVDPSAGKGALARVAGQPGGTRGEDIGRAAAGFLAMGNIGNIGRLAAIDQRKRDRGVGTALERQVSRASDWSSSNAVFMQNPAQLAISMTGPKSLI
jgi:hypothetical protein